MVELSISDEALLRFSCAPGALPGAVFSRKRHRPVRSSSFRAIEEDFHADYADLGLQLAWPLAIASAHGPAHTWPNVNISGMAARRA